MNINSNHRNSPLESHVRYTQTNKIVEKTFKNKLKNKQNKLNKNIQITLKTTNKLPSPRKRKKKKTYNPLQGLLRAAAFGLSFSRGSLIFLGGEDFVGSQQCVTHYVFVLVLFLWCFFRRVGFFVGFQAFHAGVYRLLVFRHLLLVFMLLC